MKEKLKEFINVGNVPIPAGTDPVTVNIATTTADSQAVLDGVRVELHGPTQWLTAELKVDGNTLSTISTEGVYTPVISEFSSGRQIVDSSSSYDLVVTPGELLYPGVSIVVLGNVSGLSSVLFDDRSIVTLDEINATNPSQLKSSDLPEDPYTNDSCRVTYKGRDAAVGIYNGNFKLVFVDDGSTVFPYPGVSASTFGVCTDGTYLYAKPSSNGSSLDRINVDTGVKDTITMTQSFPGRRSNQAGVMEYHAGYIYSNSSNSSNLYKIDATDGTVTVLTSSLVAKTYITGSAITTTTEASPRTLLVIFSDAKTEWVDLASGARSESSTATGGSTFYGNAGFEFKPGVVFGGYLTTQYLVDFNGGAPVFSSVTMFPRLGNGYASICTKTIAPLGAENSTYSLYAAGVEITEVNS